MRGKQEKLEEPAMTSISVQDATDHFKDVLKQVENGETVQITRDGRPIARISGIQTFDPDEAERAAREWIAFRDRRKSSLGDITVRELIEEGRM
jgi:prevent-host-death family protein